MADSPLYALSAVICLDAACTCSSSLTRSMGATAVLEIAAAMPPAAKSFMKLIGSSAFPMVPVVCSASFFQRDPRGERGRRCSAARDLTNTSAAGQSPPRLSARHRYVTSAADAAVSSAAPADDAQLQIMPSRLPCGAPGSCCGMHYREEKALFILYISLPITTTQMELRIHHPSLLNINIVHVTP